MPQAGSPPVPAWLQQAPPARQDVEPAHPGAPPADGAGRDPAQPADSWATTQPLPPWVAAQPVAPVSADPSTAPYGTGVPAEPTRAWPVIAPRDVGTGPDADPTGPDADPTGPDAGPTGPDAGPTGPDAGPTGSGGTGEGAAGSARPTPTGPGAVGSVKLGPAAGRTAPAENVAADRFDPPATPAETADAGDEAGAADGLGGNRSGNVDLNEPFGMDDIATAPVSGPGGLIPPEVTPGSVSPGAARTGEAASPWAQPPVRPQSSTPATPPPEFTSWEGDDASAPAPWPGEPARADRPEHAGQGNPPGQPTWAAPIQPLPPVPRPPMVESPPAPYAGQERDPGHPVPYPPQPPTWAPPQQGWAPGQPQPGQPQQGYPPPGYPAPPTGYPAPPTGYPQPGYPQPGYPAPDAGQPGYPAAAGASEYDDGAWAPDSSVPTAEEFAQRRAVRPADPVATTGVRAAVNKLGLVRLAPSRHEQEMKHDVEMVRRNFGGLRQVTVVNPKGGAGKTVAILLLAMTFGQKRGGYVLAWDNNETQGTLGMRAQQDFHSRTVRDLLRDLGQFQGAYGRIGDLSQYVRAQGEGMFDVLASDESATGGEMLTARAFGEIREVVSRFYKLIFVDTGNNVRAQNWQAAIDATDQLLITMSARNDSAETAARMLDHLEQSGRHRLVRQAVTVVSMPPSRKEIDLPAIERHFAARTRAVLLAPYERLIDTGEPMRYGQLSAASRDAWLKIAAAVAEGL
ncbi:chromosome partitioning protein [Plantactinospora sp. KBS50]|uniref:chromosome partitioning protein n=1 Tax=Plantactinospora sp. KBS50 TaxID=2024580 RepID=UPI003517B5C1